MALKDLPSFVVIVFLGLVCWLLWENRRLSRDLRQVGELSARQMEKNTAAVEALARAVEAKAPRRRGAPQLEAEPRTGAGT